MRSNGRPSLIDWAATSHDGDAASGATDVDAWLGEQPAARSDAEWQQVLGGLRDGMQTLMSSRLVQGDAVCREILGGLDQRSSLDDLDAAMDAIGHRLAARSRGEAVAVAPPAPLPPPLPEPRKAGALRSFLRL